MNFSFHPEAEAEFSEAVEYYEECEDGLGYDFLSGGFCFSSEHYQIPDSMADHWRGFTAVPGKPLPVWDHLQY